MDTIKTYVKRPEIIRAIQFHKRNLNSYSQFGIVIGVREGEFFLERKPFDFVRMFEGDYIFLDKNNKPTDKIPQLYFERWFIEVDETTKEIKSNG